MDPSSASYASALNDFQTEMRSLLNLSNYSRSDILDLLVWSDGRYLYYILYNQTKYFQPTYQIEKQEWFDKVFRNNGKIIFASNYSKNKETGVLSGNSFDMVRNINNLVNREQKNLIILNVSTKYFDEQFEKMNLLFQSFVVITGGEGNIIYSSRPITANILRSIISKRVFRYDDTNWQVLTTDSNEFDLKVHVIYSLDDVKYQTSVLIGYILLISIGGIFLAVILFRHFNKWISSSAKAITSTFSELENGNLSARCPEVYVKEYNEIGHSVNKAITRLEEKIKNEYLLTIQQKTVQLYALQSQIQPHFLINTIYCFIALNQIGETEKLTNAF
jgi:sensor histidine kinase YesM